MNWIKCVALLGCLAVQLIESARLVEVTPVSGNEEDRKFPEWFKFGAATAAYQIEGGWNEDGRGPSVWDTLTHDHPELVVDRDNGDVAADSYHRFQDDIKALQEVGVSVLG